MRFPSEATVERMREKYPVGCRVRLVKMDDSFAPPIGTLGTVQGVDDTGSIMVAWDNGSGLNVLYGVDRCRRLSQCPKCGEYYSGHPAISRADNRTHICPMCGYLEAVQAAGLDEKTIDEIMSVLKQEG